MNKEKLQAVMVENRENGKILSEALGISQQTFSAKINEKNGNGFTQPEIMFIKNRYNLSSEQLDSIFFKQKVS